MFDGSGTPPAPGEVTLDGDRVVAVTTGGREEHGADEVVDATGCTVMPGLVESHAHLTFPSGPAGACTAIAAHDGGASVVIVEAAAHGGGNASQRLTRTSPATAESVPGAKRSPMYWPR